MMELSDALRRQAPTACYEYIYGSLVAMRSLLLLVLICLVGGCVDPSALERAREEAAKAEEEAEPEPPPVAQQPPAGGPAAPNPKRGIPDVEARVVDKQKAMAENPELKEVGGKINALDPVSQATQSYFVLGQRVHLLNFKHQIDLHKAQYGSNPTFDQFMDYAKQMQIEFKMLKPWQVYAYDESDGSITVLSDYAEKRRRYEEAGLEFKED